MEQAKIKDQEKLPKGLWEPSKRGLSRVSRGDSGTGLFERGLSQVSRGDSWVGLLQGPAIRNEAMPRDTLSLGLRSQRQRIHR